MPSINLKNNELDFTPTFGTQHILTSMQTKDKKTITILDTSTPEECHQEIYSALKLNPNPIKRKITKRQLV